MDDAQQRITFDFAGDMQIQYLPKLPEVGDFISHASELWVVRRIDQDDAGPIVTCELPAPQRA